MKPKQLFICSIIILLATTLILPKTQEQKYCNQYSGETEKEVLSEDYLACESDTRCRVDTENIESRETDDLIVFSCIPNEVLDKRFPN